MRRLGLTSRPLRLLQTSILSTYDRRPLRPWPPLTRVLACCDVREKGDARAPHLDGIALWGRRRGVRGAFDWHLRSLGALTNRLRVLKSFKIDNIYTLLPSIYICNQVSSTAHTACAVRARYASHAPPSARLSPHTTLGLAFVRGSGGAHMIMSQTQTAQRRHNKVTKRAPLYDYESLTELTRQK